MSLLLNEEFSTYSLRHAYLQHIHDGVGERLINLNTAVLNNPAFRAAGWFPDTAITRRCYSPPIPTTSAGVGVGNEYFNAPRRGQLQDGEGEEEEGAGGMVTGQQASEDTIAAGLGLGLQERRKRQRTRKEQLEEEDSSDLSDEDSESEIERTAAQGIEFRKMPLRGRSQSSPPKTAHRIVDDDDDEGDDRKGLEVMITEPSKPSDGTALRSRGRGSSLSSQVDAVKQRARRDTTTSSEMSSENEAGLDTPAFFNRKLPGRPEQRPKKTVMLSERIQEEEEQLENVELGDVSGEDRLRDSDLEDEDVDEASDLSDEFEAAGGDSPALGIMSLDVGRASDEPSPLKPQQADMPPAVEAGTSSGSPKKKGERELSLPKLPRLPPGRPMSRLPPPSLITMALKGNNGGSGDTGEKPFQRFADLSGKGEASPLWIKVYAPFSSTPTDPIEVPLRRTREGQPVTVSELIGLALWRYNEEEFEPTLTSDPKDSNINRWDLRIVEDEEVDYDFPALVRTRPVTDFTSNNNRPPQRRARDKPWDEFGLVRASDEQFKENEEVTPQIVASFNTPQQPPTQEQAKAAPISRPEMAVRSETETSVRSTATATFHPPPRNPITGPSFAPAALRKDTGNLALDAPQQATAQSTPRTGAPKTVTVHFTDPQSFATSNLAIQTTADTYIAEIFDHSTQKLGLEKGLYVLKVHGTQTVAPSDRTVEALGDRLGLDLVRRRFMGGAGGAGDGIFGLGLSGSPGSSSPNAPLEMVTTASGTPPPGGKKAKRGAAAFGNFTSVPNTSAVNLNAAVGLGLAFPPTGGTGSGSNFDAMLGGKRYNVLRRQPLSFTPSHPRTLIISPEYMQILPAAPDSLAAPTGKVTNVPMASVIGVKVSRKHPKMVRVLVYREKETKRYDFEAGTKEEATMIVADVRRALEAGGLGGGI